MDIKTHRSASGTDQTVPDLASAVSDGQSGEAALPDVQEYNDGGDAAAEAIVPPSQVGEMSARDAGATSPASTKRKPHEVLARELGISDKTVREKRKLGMSDEDIATEAAVLSPKHDPLKFKRDEPLPLLDAVIADAPVEASNHQLRAENLRARQLSNEQEELKLRKMRGELLSVDQVMEQVLPAFGAVKDGLMAMVERLAPRLAPISDPAEIRREMYAEVLSSFGAIEKLIRAGGPVS